MRKHCPQPKACCRRENLSYRVEGGGEEMLRFHLSGVAAWQQASGMAAEAGNLKILTVTAIRKQRDNGKWGL